ncbi:MAG: DUF2905 family protein [Nitrosomonadaceae bacterium]
MTLAVKTTLWQIAGRYHYLTRNFNFYFPLTSGLLVSAVLTLLLWRSRK